MSIVVDVLLTAWEALRNASRHCQNPQAGLAKRHNVPPQKSLVSDEPAPYYASPLIHMYLPEEEET